MTANRFLNFVFFILLIFSFAACQKEKKQELPTPIDTDILSIKTPDFVNRFEADPVLRKIHDWKDRRVGDSLAQLLSHQNPTYRTEAAYAFASVQDSFYIDTLLQVLQNDLEEQVRVAAAFALGQLYMTSIGAKLIFAYENENSPLVHRYLLEAIGKCADELEVNFLASLAFTDDLHCEGQALGIFRATERNKNCVTRRANMRMSLLLLPSRSARTRLIASEYFARNRKIGLHERYLEQLQEVASTDKNRFVRAHATLALSGVASPLAEEDIRRILWKTSDPIIKVAALQALSEREDMSLREPIWKALKDSSMMVRQVAASVLRKQPIAKELELYLKEAKNHSEQPHIQAELWAAALQINFETAHKALQVAYQNTDNIYHKSAYLSAYAESVKGYDFLVRIFMESSDTLERSFALQSLVAMQAQKDLPLRNLYTRFAQVFKTALGTADAGLIALAAAALRNNKANYKSFFSKEESQIFYQALDTLRMPQDIESYREVQQTISLFEEREIELKKLAHSNPIDWSFIQTLEANPEISIETERGTMYATLYLHDAPLTVSQFVKQAQAGYFDNKAFHRVIPNFVVQTGCPRGDGWGSTDDFIRSEFAPIYYEEAGCLGMASAGKDTESVQWFASHVPLPHLDGRYTLFGKITQGVSLLKQIQMGDKILKIRLISPKFDKNQNAI
ncbi:MAG: peptidylprolyl isomerase [Bernardetiaceae bacterium]|nr:peptidylprolyl isomerase [Bernardetiaceae bacterium]